MTPQDFLLRVVDFLDQNALEYVLTGSLAAAAVYGRPRLVKDFDLMVNAPTLTLARLEAAFPKTHFSIRERKMELGAFENQNLELTERGWGWRAELFLPYHAAELNPVEPAHKHAAVGHALFVSSFEQRRRVSLGAHSIWLVRPELILLIKLALCTYSPKYRAKDYEDAFFLYRVQRDMLDFDYLNGEMERLGLLPFWEKLIREAKNK